MDEIEGLMKVLEKKKEEMIEEANEKKQKIIDDAIEELRLARMEKINEARDLSQKMIEDARKEATELAKRNLLENQKVLNGISNISEEKLKKALNYIVREVLED
ncbi:MAG: hypothetical protein ACTSVY_06785 [Candidatus Helarchaeota archaeon]